jgi:hypothetical protein
MRAFDILTRLFPLDAYSNCMQESEELWELAAADAFNPFPELRELLQALALSYGLSGNSDDNKISNVLLRDVLLQASNHHNQMTKLGVWN